MEATTPPNSTGFNKKQNRKQNRIARKGKPSNSKKNRNLTPKEIERAKCLGGMLFLIYAAKQIAELFSDSPVETNNSL